MRSQKKDFVQQIKIWYSRIKNDRPAMGSHQNLQAIRFDKGVEFFNRDTKIWTNVNEIKLEPTIGYHPEENRIE